MRCALRLFAQRGFDGTTLSDIAAEADISLSLLRHYFGRKGAIAEAIAANDSHVFDNAIEELGTAIREARSCRAFLAQLGNAYFAWVRERQWLYTLWIQNHHEFRIVDTVGPQIRRAHEVFARRLMTMRDFSSDERGATFAIRTLCGSLLYSALVGPRLGVPPIASSDGEITELAETIALRICNR